MDINALAAELTAGQPDTGAYDADHAVAAGQLNALNRTRLRPLTMQELREWAGLNAHGFNIYSAITNTALTDQERNVAYVADKLMGTDGGSLDPGNILHLAIVNVLVTAGIIDTDDRAALADKATEEISRATELGLGVVRAGDVQRART